jgi:hypothetical protein
MNFEKGGGASLYSGYADLTQLESLVGMAPGGLAHVKSLARAVAERSETLIDFWGQEAPMSSVRFSSPKVCPACLRENGYCSRLWDLLPVTACPIHNAVLEDTCARCCERITWTRGSLCICPCGYDWRNARPAEAHSAAVEIARQVYRLCGCGFGRGGEAWAGANALYDLSLAEFCRSLFLVADHYLIGKEGRRLTTAESNRECHEAYARAYEAFERWPRDFHEFLDEFGFSQGEESLSVDPLFRLHSQVEKHAPDFMAAELEKYCLGVPMFGVIRGFPIHLLDRRFARKEEVCAFYNLDREVLETGIRSGQVRVFALGAGRKTLLYVSSVSELVAILRS